LDRADARLCVDVVCRTGGLLASHGPGYNVIRDSQGSATTRA
jgi:hypothetical protein